MAKRRNAKAEHRPEPRSEKLDLVKFPRTRHLLDAGGNGVSRDDLLMTAKEAIAFLKGKVVSVEEKVDGANLGFSVNKNNEIRAQNRSHFVISNSHQQFSTLEAWISRHSASLLRVLEHGKFILYGEWAYAKHSIFYTRLPSYFVAFDIYDTDNGHFVSRKTRDKMLNGTGIATVPLIVEKEFRSPGELLPYLEAPSAYYDGPVEGIYLRVDEDTQDNHKAENSGTLLQRAKIVRPDFLQQIEEQWTRQKFVKNICEVYY
ncbi:uncharacterized protein LOC135683141 [Rhopilema esculentum]|uniref:uncharacterized protein LOC135683141 n=1 Tax=Rhopilema esculentum TaxID=499914 RepID=UPI0031E0109F|eukprot:gene15996-7329_t